MGIPGLTAKLRPYAVPTKLGSYHVDASQDTSSVIIDGPSLAYHIYYRLLARKPALLNALDAAPSYYEIGQGALVFLDALRDHDVVIDSIYFDGFLPLPKQSIRYSRLEGNLKQLVTFHSTHSNGLTVLSDVAKPLVIEVGHVLDSSRPVPPSFKGLPAAPFLVPAVIEALKSNRHYTPMVQIVPAEADAYCVAAARENGGVILTSDSDMLVHNIGPIGAVAFFDQFELKRSAAGSTSIHVMICRPCEISKRLALDDLRRLAFEIKKDPSSSFEEALKRARRYKHMGITDVHYKDFLEEYASEPCNTAPSRWSMDADPPIDPFEQWLDPRVSELVLQFAAQKEHPVKMYLPSLIDDPSRSPAWGVSSSLRCFAYSLLLFLTTEAFNVRSVVEYGRRGLRIASQEVQLLTKQQCLTYVEGLKDSFSQLRGRLESSSPLHFFKAYAIYMVCQWYVDNGKPRPTRDGLLELLTGAAGRMLTWTKIHLSAQLQAALYSLRIVKQVLKHVMAVMADIPTLLRDLDMSLEDLEPIDKLIPTRMEVAEKESSNLET